MPLKRSLAKQIEELIPRLAPNVYTAQMPTTYEFATAEADLQLKVSEVINVTRPKVDVEYLGQTRRQAIYGYEGRPYIRVTTDTKVVDVFLLPPK